MVLKWWVMKLQLTLASYSTIVIYFRCLEQIFGKKLSSCRPQNGCICGCRIHKLLHIVSTLVENRIIVRWMMILCLCVLFTEDWIMSWSMILCLCVLFIERRIVSWMMIVCLLVSERSCLSVTICMTPSTLQLPLMRVKCSVHTICWWWMYGFSLKKNTKIRIISLGLEPVSLPYRLQRADYWAKLRMAVQIWMKFIVVLQPKGWIATIQYMYSLH